MDYKTLKTDEREFLKCKRKNNEQIAMFELLVKEQQKVLTRMKKKLKKASQMEVTNADDLIERIALVNEIFSDYKWFDTKLKNKK